MKEMPMLNKKLMVGLVAVAACFGLGAASLAGTKTTPSHGRVTVLTYNDGSGQAIGRLGDIYNGSGKREYIGCQHSDDGITLCQARNEAGKHVVCVTDSAWLSRAVKTLSPDAQLVFHWNARGTCTTINVTHDSAFAAKQD